jgi:hypothetical protein
MSEIGDRAERLSIRTLTSALLQFTDDEESTEATQEAWKQAKELAKLLDQPYAPDTDDGAVLFAKRTLLDFLALFAGGGSYEGVFKQAVA